MNGWGGGVGNLEQAEASFEMVLSLDPDSMQARRGLIAVLFSMGLSEAMLLQGQEAERLGRPDDVETLLARANAFALSSLHAQAIPIQRRIIAIDPRNDEAYFFLTYASVASDQFEETVEIGNRFLTLFGEDEAVRFWIARAAVGLGDDSLAREHYEAVTRALMAPSTDPGRVTWVGIASLLFSGAFYDQSGEHDRAEAVWQRGVELVRLKVEVDPENNNLHMFLAGFPRIPRRARGVPSGGSTGGGYSARGRRQSLVDLESGCRTCEAGRHRPCGGGAAERPAARATCSLAADHRGALSVTGGSGRVRGLPPGV